MHKHKHILAHTIYSYKLMFFFRSLYSHHYYSNIFSRYWQTGWHGLTGKQACMHIYTNKHNVQSHIHAKNWELRWDRWYMYHVSVSYVCKLKGASKQRKMAKERINMAWWPHTHSLETDDEQEKKQRQSWSSRKKRKQVKSTPNGIKMKLKNGRRKWESDCGKKRAPSEKRARNWKTNCQKIYVKFDIFFFHTVTVFHAYI